MTDLYPITLGIARPNPQKGQKTGGKKKKQAGPVDSGATSLSSSSSGEGMSKALKEQILERDNHTCGCCGFRSKKYQEVLFKDGDESNHDPSNLMTTCIFCHQCFNLEKVSVMRSGVLLWLPEVEQHQLNNIARAIYIARISQGPMADAARKTLEILMERREEIKTRLTTDNPAIVATVLGNYLSPPQYAARVKKLEGVRLFPLDRRIIKEAELEFNQFPQILAYWRSKDGPYGGKPPVKWLDLYQEMPKAA